MLGQRWPAVLTISAVLFAGLTNAHAHVHLCLDGQERPASVHVVDSSNHLHDHFGGTQGHDDFDLDVPNETLAKTLKYDAPAIVSAMGWTAAVATTASSAPIVGRAPAPKPPPYFSRPPPRGPPH